ncbi:MAG: hypothetical protein JWN50_18 [Parcubacteria group bacterium]|nr:hypothetical protein [Parcubacteria group bacterium]
MALGFASLGEAQTRTKPLNPKIDALFPDSPKNFLTDLAHIVKDSDQVNARLKALRDSDRLNLVVVTLPTIGDESIDDVAREIGRKWMVATANDTLGSAVRNTGGVILLVPSIRKCRVEVATGSEGYMTDSRAADACRAAADDFRANNFGAGFISIANTFAAYHKEELAREAEARLPKTPSQPIPWIPILGWLAAIGLPLSLFLRHRYVKARQQEEKEQAERERQDAEDRRLEAAARAERERLAAIERQRAEEQERIRWNSLTPVQQAAEVAERRRQAAAAAERRRLQEIEDAKRRKREAEEAEQRRRQQAQNTSTFTPTSSSSDSNSSSGGFGTGGSDSFGGGGGGSDY